jgi:hypothetical protein
MPKASKSDGTKAEKMELDPHAWPKFEKLIKSAAKMGHKPHQPKPKKK